MKLKTRPPLTEIEKETLDIAKQLIMVRFSVSEQTAYHFIRKLAMDTKRTRVAVAITIIKEEL